MKQKITIVEDDRAIVALLKEALKMAGFEIEIFDLAKTAIEGLKEIKEGKKEKPDLILLDLLLPDMNGIEVLKEAKKYPETKNIKIFALTNYSNPKFNQELVKEGIDKILIKSEHTLNELVKIIKEALNIK